MKKIILSGVIAILLSGCATVQPSIIPAPQHHRIAKPAAIVAPIIPAPVVKKTFKQRWLSKFFRDRATAK